MSRTLVYVSVGLVGLAAVLMVLGSVIERTRGVRFRPGWACGVVGLRGGGKSLFVARLISRRLGSGVNIVANFTVPGCVKMNDWRDLALAPEGSMVILDEAHQWARAQAGKSPDPWAEWYVSHVRKLRHEFWWIAQHENQVGSFLRNQTNEMVLCEQFIGGVHRAKSFAPHEFRKVKSRPLWTWWYSPRGAAIKVYDTLELVEPSIGERDSVDHRSQKEEIREVIAALRARKGEASTLAPAEPEKVQEPAAPLSWLTGDRLSVTDDYASRFPA